MGKIFGAIANLKLHPYQVFTCVAGSFIVGIFAGGYFATSWSRSWLVFVMLAFCLLLSGLVNLILRNRLLVLASWLLLFLVAGIADYSYHQNSFCKVTEGEVALLGVIVSNPVKDYKKQQAIIETEYSGCHLRLLANLPHFPDYHYGQRLALKGKLVKPGMIEDFDYEKFLRPKHVNYLLQSPGEIAVTGKDQSIRTRLLSGLYGVKAAIENSVARSIREPEAALGIGILTGAKASISESLQNDLNSAGLTHLIALSGFNITIIISAIALIISGYTSRKNVFWAGAVLSISFIVMTGAAASVVRAGIFSLLILYAKTIGRKAYQTNLLMLTAVLMLALNPFLLRDDMGFQLSFLAFGGLVYLARPISFLLERSKIAGLPQLIKAPLMETLAAQTAVFPLIAFAFGRISIISPLSNVVVLWLVPWAMLTTFIVAIAGLMLPSFGVIFGLVAWPLLAYIIKVASLSARLPFASIGTPKYSLPLISILYSLIIVIFFLTMRRLSRIRKGILK